MTVSNSYYSPLAHAREISSVRFATICTNFSVWSSFFGGLYKCIWGYNFSPLSIAYLEKVFIVQ
jgi:hypothetical protein